MFPGPHAQVYYNEAGEPLGWDYPSHDEPPEPSDEDERRWDAMAARAEDRAYEAEEWAADTPEPELAQQFGEWACQADQFDLDIEHAWNNFLEWKEKHP